MFSASSIVMFKHWVNHRASTQQPVFFLTDAAGAGSMAVDMGFNLPVNANRIQLGGRIYLYAYSKTTFHAHHSTPVCQPGEGMSEVSQQLLAHICMKLTQILIARGYLIIFTTT